MKNNTASARTRKIQGIVVLAVTLAFCLILMTAMQFVSIGIEKTKQRKLETELALIQEKIENIEDAIAYRESMLYVEQYARDELGLSREDEIKFVPKGE